MSIARRGLVPQTISSTSGPVSATFRARLEQSGCVLRGPAREQFRPGRRFRPLRPSAFVCSPARMWPFLAEPNSDVRNGKPLMVPFTRSRLRRGHAFAGSKGSFTITHFSGVLSGCSTPRNFFCALTLEESVIAGPSPVAAEARTSVITSRTRLFEPAVQFLYPGPHYCGFAAGAGACCGGCWPFAAGCWPFEMSWPSNITRIVERYCL